MEMLEFIVLFSIKSALVLTVLWLPFALLLRREKFFRFNRIVLLSIIVLSFLIPLLDVPALRIETASHGVIEFGMPQALIEMQEGFRKAPHPYLYNRCGSGIVLPSEELHPHEGFHTEWLPLD